MGESERGEGGGVGKGERLGSEREGGIGERWDRKQWGEGGNCETLLRMQMFGTDFMRHI